ncbi:MAG: hypothetical protein AAGE52_22645 [Myxococcota bacterium]
MRWLIGASVVLVAITTTTAQRSAWTEVAAQYRGWVRTSQLPQFNSIVCPFADGEAPARSVTRSAATHGGHARKVFFVYSSDAAAYHAVLAGAAPVEGLTVVKESFWPADLGAVGQRTTRTANLPSLRPEHRPERYTPVHANGRVVGIGEPIGLFTMRYQRGEWRFATVNFDGTIEASGEMPRCAACHQSAPHHGLFGPHGSPVARTGGSPRR